MKLNRQTFNLITVCLSLGLTGCDGMDRVINGTPRSRDSGYDTTPAPVFVRTEPYGVFEGYKPDGEKIYLIHWKGNTLDDADLTESAIDALGFKKYES